MSISSEQDSTAHPTEQVDYGKWFSILGVLLILLGIVAIVAAFAATLATVLFFGVLLLMGGLAQVFHAFSAIRWQGFLFHLLGGLLYGLIGVLLVADPVSGAIGLTLLLASFFVAGGILKLVLGVQAASTWFAVSGGIDLLLGLLVLIGWPETGTWVIGLFLGIEMVFAGLSLLLFSSAIRPSARMDR